MTKRINKADMTTIRKVYGDRIADLAQDRANESTADLKTDFRGGINDGSLTLEQRRAISLVLECRGSDR